MKAAPFGYVRPATLDDVVAELVAGDGEAKVIAGGQSLVPVLAMRLARPATLVDVNAVAGFEEMRATGDALTIGATVRQRRAEREPAGALVPLLRMALPWVGHRELRSRGTVCGSLAHADPAAELPAVAACLNAELTLTGPHGERSVPAREFFAGAMTTLLGPEDVLTAARFPVARRGEGYGFAEIARRNGDFALAGAAARVAVRDGRPVEATVTAFGVSDRPVTRDVTAELAEASDAVDGPADPARFAERVTPVLEGPLTAVADEVVDTDGDAHGSGDYRRRVFAALATRELAKAHSRAVRDPIEVRS